jgi:hypothetical protein
MKIYRLLPFIPIALLLGACGHTNNLAKYNVAGKSAYFRTIVSGDAASAFSSVENPAHNTITEVLAAVGSVIVTDQAHRKLERAINGDSIARAISNGTQQATSDYLSLHPVQSMADDPDIIVETELTDYRLVSGSLGMAVEVKGESRMIDRRTGRIIWDNSESKTIPLSETYLAALGSRPVRSGVSIFNAVRLLSLSEEEIRQVVDNAATDAGREIGETLREDVADLGK